MKEKVLQISIEDFIGKQHRIPTAEGVLPFSSNSGSKVLRNNFPNVIGDLARSITNKKVIEFSPKYEYHPETQPLSNFIAECSNIEIENEDDRVDLVRIIDSFLFDGDELKMKHPYLYNLKKEQTKNSYFKNIADFIERVFFEEEPEVLTIFQLDETKHVLLNLILNRVTEVMEVTNTTKSKNSYANLLPYFTDLFIKDLRYLKKHNEYFLGNLELFLNFYMFMYPVQLLEKLERFSGDQEKVEPFYFALEWEEITKRRLVADPYKGYLFIKERLPRLFVHQQVLQQLSINFMNEQKEVKSVVSYKRLFKEIESYGKSYENKFIEDLKEWIIKYSTEFANLNVPTLASTKEELVEQLFLQVSQGMSATNQKNYGDKVIDLGVNKFLKQRGNLGYLFSMNYDLLMLLTAVIVKDKPMPFNQVLEGFEQRGIAFDRHSIAIIIDLFNKQNILDNKSDSGDAQYVKPIL